MTTGTTPRLAPNPPSVLEIHGLNRSFGSTRALRDVAFELRAGEVMALLGENGAGKSTLVKTLAGLVVPDSGTITFLGEPFPLGKPSQARARGIAVAAQEVSIIGPLTVAENVFLGGPPFSGLWSIRRLSRAARPYLSRVGLEGLDPARPAEELSVAERQLVEIARLLALDSQVLILDEPTAALSDAEIVRVKKAVLTLAAAGKAVVYVTHRLGEVFEIADRITIMRNGESQPPVAVRDITIDELVRRMIGRELEQAADQPAVETPDTVVLQVEDLLLARSVSPVRMDVHAGEILGIAGQLGSGAGDLLRTIAGLIPMREGRIRVDGQALPRAHSLRTAISAGIAYCSSDRKHDGIFPGLSAATNFTAPALGSVSRWGWINASAEAKAARSMAEFFAVDTARLKDDVGKFSGGNQQKVALGKWVSTQPRILLVEEPTRGVDVGARAEIYRHLRELAAGGMAVVIASSDLDEIRGRSDTVATMFRGRLVRIRPASECSLESILTDITHPVEVSA